MRAWYVDTEALVEEEGRQSETARERSAKRASSSDEGEEKMDASFCAGRRDSRLMRRSMARLR